MDFASFGIASVACITVICYLAATAVKQTPLANKWLPSICGALGGLLGRKDAAAGQLLELCIAPDAGQHDESCQQGGKNENGPFLLHGDASPCGCKKNKVYYSISNRAKKGEG